MTSKPFISRLRFLGQIAVANPPAVWRHILYLLSGWLYPRYKRSVIVLPCSGGFGDNLMFTALAREVRKRNPKALIHVITSYPDVYLRNPDVDFVSKRQPGRPPWRRHFRVRYNHGFPWKNHFLHSLCRTLDIPGRIDLKCYVHPSSEDLAFADALIHELGSPPIVLARTAGHHDTIRKNWPEPYWISLASKLLLSHPVLDVGLDGPPLPLNHKNYRSLKGKTTFHQLAALFQRSKAVITMDSSTNHLAAAFEIPTVCILGGVFPPDAIRYPRTKVLTNRPPCADCWNTPGCNYELKCLQSITPHQVIAALEDFFPELAARPASASTKPASQPLCPSCLPAAIKP